MGIIVVDVQKMSDGIAAKGLLTEEKKRCTKTEN